MDVDDMLAEAAQALYDKKGTNIIALDLRGVSSFADYFLIAEGNVDRHVIALADEVRTQLKKGGEMPFHVDGAETGDWLVMDYGNLIVHLFTPELRERYRLEELFSEAKIVDLELR